MTATQIIQLPGTSFSMSKTRDTRAHEAQVTLASDDERWAAVLRRDRSMDGQFFYSVRTTGVYCRPSCASRRALRENVSFYPTRAAAEREAGEGKHGGIVEEL